MHTKLIKIILTYIVVSQSLSGMVQAQNSNTFEEDSIFMACESRTSSNIIRPILDGIERRYERELEDDLIFTRVRASARFLGGNKQVISYPVDEILGDINFDSNGQFEGTITPLENLEVACEYRYQITVRITRRELDVDGQNGSSDTYRETGLITIRLPTLRRINF